MFHSIFVFHFVRIEKKNENAGVLSQRGPEFDNMNTAGSPIVLQRRGSVYGANVPMITGNK